MIEWGSFLTVAIASIVFTTAIVFGFSLAVRLLTNSQALLVKVQSGDTKAIPGEALNRIGSYMLFTLCSLALLFGIWLVIPRFHK
jgi:hypothetical protein